MQQRRKIFTEMRVFACLGVCFAIGFILSMNSFKDSHISTDSSIPVDAIVIPGGGSQRGEEPESLPSYVIERLNAGLEYYSRLRQQGHKGTLVFIVLSQGTVHRPNYVNKLGWPVSESTSEALYLLHEAKRRKIELRPEDILRENVSFDTIGNAFFARIIHCDVAGFRRLHIITSLFHLARTRAIFEFIFGCIPTFKPYILSFEGTPNVVDGERLAAREEHEKKSLNAFYEMVSTKFGVKLMHRSELDDASMTLAPRNNVRMRDVHHFVFSEHLAYLSREGLIPRPSEGENANAAPKEAAGDAGGDNNNKNDNDGKAANEQQQQPQDENNKNGNETVSNKDALLSTY